MVPGTGRKEARCILCSFVQTSCGVILPVPLGRLLRMFARVPVLYVCCASVSMRLRTLGPIYSYVLESSEEGLKGRM